MSRDANHDRGPDGDDLDLTAYGLGQVDEAERAAIERQLAESSGDGRRLIEQTQRVAEEVRAALNEANPAASKSLRKTVLHRLGNDKEDAKPQPAEKPQSFWRRHAVEMVAVSLGLLLVAALLLPVGSIFTSRARHTQVANNVRQLDGRGRWDESDNGVSAAASDADWDRAQQGSGSGVSGLSSASGQAPATGEEAVANSQSMMKVIQDRQESQQRQMRSGIRSSPPADSFGTHGMAIQPGTDHSGGGIAATTSATTTAPSNPAGTRGRHPEGWYYRYNGQSQPHYPLGTVNGQGQAQGVKRGGQGQDGRHFVDNLDAYYFEGRGRPADSGLYDGIGAGGGPGTEQYAPIIENAFIQAQGLDALSTFSIDVDTASYANVRRFLSQRQLPPANAVRLEELVNYFSYDYPQPKAGEPFSVNLETAECPWQPNHLLLRVGLKGREIHHKERPVSNLVFLLDVSGSMADENKLPLLKQVLSMMVRELREDDRVSIVTYAGEAGLRLPPTTGDQQERILQAIDSLQSGGSTNGSAGIELAYEQAKSYFRPEGTNRVILATDGDLNVGITDDESLVQLIKQKAAGGVFLTVLGFGDGNLKDAKMERLADNGNGLFAYIDSVREGRKVLIEQMSGSLVTIAKDVKIQIEFNPGQVQAYRLIGYENRMLTAPEFADDRRDAGEIGAGHTVTALYELVPTGQPAETPGSGEAPRLRYQTGEGVQGSGFRVQKAGDKGQEAASGDLLTLSLRYKEPDGMVSKLSEHPLASRGGKFNAATRDFQFAAAVASFGMQLRSSQYRGQGNLAAVAEIAAASIGEDKGGYRAEFVDLVRKAQTLGVK